MRNSTIRGLGIEDIAANEEKKEAAMQQKEQESIGSQQPSEESFKENESN